MDAEDARIVEMIFHIEDQEETPLPLDDNWSQFEDHDEKTKAPLCEEVPAAPEWRQYRYKRVIVPARVVVGYLGDFGADIPYLNRRDMLRDVRGSIRFCDWWLRTFVLRTQLPDTWRLRRNMVHKTRELRYYDIFEYERYLRWNVEYRFYKVAVREIYAALQRTKMPSEHVFLVLSYLF
jgi:hypothetical protein